LLIVAGENPFATGDELFLFIRYGRLRRFFVVDGDKYGIVDKWFPFGLPDGP
jgi:hypothetical protein